MVEPLLGRTWVRIIDVALLFVMLALGLNVVVGFCGTARPRLRGVLRRRRLRVCSLRFSPVRPPLAFFLLLPLGAGVACLFGVLLGAPTLRLRGDYLAIVTLGFGEIIRIFLNNLNRPVTSPMARWESP